MEYHEFHNIYAVHHFLEASSLGLGLIPCSRIETVLNKDMTYILCLVDKIGLKVYVLRQFDEASELLEERKDLACIHETLDVVCDPLLLIVVESFKPAEVKQQCHSGYFVVYVASPHFLIKRI